MARTEGRHRITRRTKIATALTGAALAVGGIAVATTAGEPQNASADAVDKSFFVDITTVAPNVKAPANQRGGSTGTFTVNCGRNENGHFNPDNFIAQPGVKNGAQHLHDYVGNLTTNADSTNESLEAGGTTCKNGDKSAYFWPVLRIDRGDAQESNAPESPAETNLDADRAQAAATAAKPQVECPDVASQLGDVSDQAMPAVGDQLNTIDAAEDQADQQMASGTPASQVLPPLRDKRKSSIDKISGLTGQKVDQQPDLSTCAVEDQNSNGIDNGSENSDPGAATTTTTAAGTTTATSTAAGTTTTTATGAGAASATSTQSATGTPSATGNESATGSASATGTESSSVPSSSSAAPSSVPSSSVPSSSSAAPSSVPSSSSAASSSSATSSSSAAATTTSALPGPDANNELAGNDGEIQRPDSVSLTFRGNPLTRVRAMPKFLRVLYGDAKPAVNGTANTKSSWTCTGFENRLIDKYPICPQGSEVERIHDFPSCWDGKNIDSANHRTHIVFPDANGRCAKGFTPVPQLRVTLVYNVPRDVQLAGQYKVDSFPEEHHDPLSDHDDFANVMSQCIMTRVVSCINRGKTCRE